MNEFAAPKGLGIEVLRKEVQREYREVAENPDKGFHFHTGRKLRSTGAVAPPCGENMRR